MKLKIKIKEVKDEERRLTVEEQCMFSKSQSTCGGILTVLATDKLRKLGFVKLVKGVDVGLFHTETVRDATPAEIMAYHCIKIHDECGLKVNECDTCVMNIWAYCTCGIGKLFLKSTKILKDKEIILEVV